jgi:hypothetical protein
MDLKAAVGNKVMQSDLESVPTPLDDTTTMSDVGAAQKGPWRPTSPICVFEESIKSKFAEDLLARHNTIPQAKVNVSFDWESSLTARLIALRKYRR